MFCPISLVVRSSVRRDRGRDSMRQPPRATPNEKSNKSKAGKNFSSADGSGRRGPGGGREYFKTDFVLIYILAFLLFVFTAVHFALRAETRIAGSQVRHRVAASSDRGDFLALLAGMTQK